MSSVTVKSGTPGSAQTSIIQNLRHNTNSPASKRLWPADNPGKARVVAGVIGIFFARASAISQNSEETNRNLRSCFQDHVWEAIEAYVSHYPANNDINFSSEATSERGVIYSMCDSSADNCRKIIDLIRSDPFCVVWPNSQCAGPDRIPLIAHLIYFQHEADASALFTQISPTTLTALSLRAKTSSNTLLIVIAQYAWDILARQTEIKPYAERAQVVRTLPYRVTSYQNPAQPLLHEQREHQQGACCCTIQ